MNVKKDRVNRFFFSIDSLWLFQYNVSKSVCERSG